MWQPATCITFVTHLYNLQPSRLTPFICLIYYFPKFIISLWQAENLCLMGVRMDVTLPIMEWRATHYMVRETKGWVLPIFTSPSYIQPGNQDHYLSSLHKSCFPLTVWSSFHIHHQLYFFSFAEQPTTQSHILLARQIEEKHSNGIALLYYMANQKASLKEYSVTYAHLISDIAHH